MGLRAGQKAWEEISIFCHFNELRNVRHQDTGQVHTLKTLYCAGMTLLAAVGLGT
jgi:hypothetical protein